MAQENLAQLFRTPDGGCYVYDPLTSHILTVREKGGDDRAILERLSPMLTPGRFSGVGWKNGFEAYRESAGHGVPRLMLQITRRCNLNCGYCVYSGAYAHMQPHAREDMRPETMQKSIDFFEEKSRGLDQVTVDLYGGEALLKPALLRMTVDYARRRLTGRAVRFRITSNGVLLDERAARWLAEEPEVQLAVTVNGPYHDHHRVTPDGRGSLDLILSNLRRIREEYPRVWDSQIQFIANITHPAQLLPLKEFYMRELGKVPLSVTFIRGQYGDEKIKAILSEKGPEPAENVYDLFCRTGDPFLAACFGPGIRTVESRALFPGDTRGYVGGCFPLVDRIYVHANGDLGICESACDRAVLGNVHTGVDEEALRALYDGAARLLDDGCRGCWAQRLCTVCLKDLLLPDGTVAEAVPEEFCRASRESCLELLRMYCAWAKGPGGEEKL